MCRNGPAASANSLSAAAYLEDFDAAWTFVRDNYAYFDAKQTDWERVRMLYRPRAAEVGSKREFVGVLKAMMEELYDPHAHLGVNFLQRRDHRHHGKAPCTS